MTEAGDKIIKGANQALDHARGSIMTLEEYICKTIKEIKSFKIEWEKNNKINPEGWPMEMNEGDWVEQLIEDFLS